jgi:hypothetical protein
VLQLEIALDPDPNSEGQGFGDILRFAYWIARSS